MNSIRFETFAPIRRRQVSEKSATMRQTIEKRLEERRAQRIEKNRRCGRVFA